MPCPTGIDNSTLVSAEKREKEQTESKQRERAREVEEIKERLKRGERTPAT